MTRKPQKTNRPINQHWVPQFYLRYFATPDTKSAKTPQVWVFSKNESDSDTTTPTSIKKVCGKRYLYAPKDLRGDRNWDVDDQITNLETLLGNLWPALADDYINLGDEHIRKAVALFISVMHLRHPDSLKKIEELHTQLVTLFQSGPVGADGIPAVESFEIDGTTVHLDAHGWHAYKNASKDDHHRFFVSLIRSEAARMAEHLMNKRWSIVFSNVDTFITTDKPVVISHSTRERFGYGSPDSIISFPLSPTRLLVLDDLHSEPCNQYYPLKSTNAGAFNLILWREAKRFLITGRKLEEVLWEICALDETESAT